ncbi:MAG: hypothetical protein AB1331_03055 [Bacillota bacterium]
MRNKYLLVGAVTWPVGELFYRWLLVFPTIESFIRHLLVLLVVKLVSDQVRYWLDRREKNWVYLEDYLLNEVLPLFGWGVALCFGQRYLELRMWPGTLIFTLVNGALPAVVYCLMTTAGDDAARREKMRKKGA